MTFKNVFWLVLIGVAINVIVELLLRPKTAAAATTRAPGGASGSW